MGLRKIANALKQRSTGLQSALKKARIEDGKKYDPQPEQQMVTTGWDECAFSPEDHAMTPAAETPEAFKTPPEKRTLGEEGQEWQLGGESFVLDAPVAEYMDSIDRVLRENELKYRPNPRFMTEVQRDINHGMRGILVGWLIEVAQEYRLSSQTLFLGVNYVDRLLSAVSVHRTKLQLVGITSLLLAAKYEEIYPPTVEDFVYIADHTYNREEVLRMESVILTTLDFALTNATAWEFARRFNKVAGLRKRTAGLTHYLTELFLQSPNHVTQLPSVVAASACYLAYFIVNKRQWAELTLYTHYTIQQLAPLVACLQELHRKTFIEGDSPVQAVKTKYAQPVWLNVSSLQPPPMDSLFPKTDGRAPLAVHNHVQ